MFKGGLEATDAGIGGAAELSSGGASSFAPMPTVGTQASSLRLVEVPRRGAAGVRRFAAIGRLRPLPIVSTRTEGWVGRYQVMLLMIDIVAAGAAGALAFFGRFGAVHFVGNIAADIGFVLVMPFGWVVVCALNRAYEGRVIGSGTTEFERVFRAFLHLFVLTGFVAYAAKLDVARGFIVAALPLALVLDVLGRRRARVWLRRARAQNRLMTPVLAVGGPESIARFTTMLRRDPSAGMHVVGACLPPTVAQDADAYRELQGVRVRVLGDVDSIRDAVRDSGARTVAVLAGEIDADKLRWISWQLEGTDTDLVVSPVLTEIGGRRLHIQPVAGLPLLHVSQPEFAGVRHVLKGAFDRILAALALLLFSPLLLGIAVLVRCTSSGPALFCQTRVGKNGKEFRMVKFRSMYVGAELRLAELLDRNDAADGLLFKIRDDPRVTGFGRVLRRWSLDELPQLINVLTGSMSLVGPRPPLPGEVAKYANDTRRRLLVKPGLTGLWQVSGRSDLSWEESVRLDLQYVENWSLVLDTVVLCKTVRAVLRAKGAY